MLNTTLNVLSADLTNENKKLALKVSNAKQELQTAEYLMRQFLSKVDQQLKPTFLIDQVFSAVDYSKNDNYSFIFNSFDAFKKGVFPLNRSSKNWRSDHIGTAIKVSRIELEYVCSDAGDIADGKTFPLWRVYGQYIKKTDGTWSNAEISTLYVDTNFKVQ